MKRLAKSAPPNPLTEFQRQYPDADWEQFRNHALGAEPVGTDYKKIKALLIRDQGGLCAYCETQLADLEPDQQRIEHFHPKSDRSNPAKNWALDWNNIIAVCIGGEEQAQKQKAGENAFPLPQNLSCDAHKNHYFNSVAKSVADDALSQLENPLQMPAFPCLFDFQRADGKLLPHVENCRRFDVEHDRDEGHTYRKILNTIKVLNLNCDRLCENRRQVLHAWGRVTKIARGMNDVQIKQKLAARWLGKWEPFFTTRRILLGSVAEDYLQQKSFCG